MNITKKKVSIQELTKSPQVWRAFRNGWGGSAITSHELATEGMLLRVEGGSESEARAIAESLVTQLNGIPVIQRKAQDATQAPDDLEANVRYLLDRCPHTVRDLSGERTGQRGLEDLVGSLSITFLGMQSQLAEHARNAQKDGVPS